jgi:hypothetical protein
MLFIFSVRVSRVSKSIRQRFFLRQTFLKVIIKRTWLLDWIRLSWLQLLRGFSRSAIFMPVCWMVRTKYVLSLITRLAARQIKLIYLCWTPGILLWVLTFQWNLFNNTLVMMLMVCWFRQMNLSNWYRLVWTNFAVWVVFFTWLVDQICVFEYI